MDTLTNAWKNVTGTVSSGVNNISKSVASVTSNNQPQQSALQELQTPPTTMHGGKRKKRSRKNKNKKARTLKNKRKTHSKYKSRRHKK